MDLNSFFALKSLPKRLKRDFDDPKLIFLTCKEIFRFLISTRCSAYFDSLSAGNMIYDIVSSEISV